MLIPDNTKKNEAILLKREENSDEKQIKVFRVNALTERKLIELLRNLIVRIELKQIFMLCQFTAAI